MKVKLVEKGSEAKGTKSFFWEPESEVDWQPGQYFYFTLPSLKYPDSRGTTRHFTISSSPTEGKLLRFTTRIREESGYKKTLDELSVGTTIESEGPSGTFILDENEKGSHIFLAGGIGITPFRVFIKYNLDKNLQIPMHLVYSNSDNEFVFGEELKQLSKGNPFIKIEFFDSSKSGHLDGKFLKPIISNEPSSTIWTVGPPVFVTAMEDALGKLGVDSAKIRTEKFTGY